MDESGYPDMQTLLSAELSLAGSLPVHISHRVVSYLKFVHVCCACVVVCGTRCAEDGRISDGRAHNIGCNQ